MKSTKNSIEHCYIDDQHIIIPSLEDWNLLQSAPVIDGNKVLGIDTSWFCSTLEFINKYPELKIGLGYLSTTWQEWNLYVFLHINSAIQRVHLEKLNCVFCGWKGRSANPMIVDLYFGEGVQGKDIQLMRVAAKYPICPCPSCGQRLPRHSIWVEY